MFNIQVYMSSSLVVSYLFTVCSCDPVLNNSNTFIDKFILTLLIIQYY